MVGRPCILVVDDDQELLKMLTRVLRGEGYRTVTTHDGSLVPALLEKHKPDLIILDTAMPKLNGFQVLDLVRKQSHVPVIMLTGKSGVNSLSKALVAGADDYLRKPFSTRELLARVRAKLRYAGPTITKTEEASD